MRKELVIGLILVLALVGYLEYRWRPVEAKMLAEPPPISKMIYPCETWIRQDGGGGKPIFSCVKAIKQ